MPYFSTTGMTAFREAEQCMDYDDAVQYAQYVEKKTNQKKTGRTANKDSSKSKVYQAEWKWQESYDQDAPLTEIEAIKYVGRVVKSKLWKELADGKQIYVEMMKDMGYHAATAGRAYGRKIVLAPRHSTKYVILHELAHCAGCMHHDVSFRQTVVKLVSRFMSADAARALKNEFKANGLKMSIRSKILSPTEWLASKNKMKKLRESACF